MSVFARRLLLAVCLVFVTAPEFDVAVHHNWPLVIAESVACWTIAFVVVRSTNDL